MGLSIRSLSQTKLSQISACFNEAFENYFVPFRATTDYLRHRWQAGGVDYELSAGVFDEEKLVGFLMFGRGLSAAQPNAHNLATGVIPAYRGQRLVAAMYDFALPRLKAAGIVQSTLEVITENEKAISAYEKVGYKKVRRLHCFSGTISSGTPIKEGFAITRAQHIDWSGMSQLPPHAAVWEQRREALQARASDYEFRTLSEHGILKAYAIVNPATGHIPSYSAIVKGEALYGLPLFQAIGSTLEKVSVHNVAADEKE